MRHEGKSLPTPLESCYRPSENVLPTVQELAADICAASLPAAN